MSIAAIQTVPYERNGQVAHFEVGFRMLEHGCTFVMNPDDHRLEFIYAIETRHEEGREHTRVETYPGKWYEIDGQTQLARAAARALLTEGASDEGDCDDRNDCEEYAVAVCAGAAI